MKPSTISVFAIITFLATIAMCALALTYPLLGSLGSESGIIFGAIIGPLMYFGGSIRGAYRDVRGFSNDLTHEFIVAAIAFALFIGTLIVNSFFVASCAQARGLLPFAVHAIPVVFLNSVLGLIVGRAIGNRLFSFLGALLLACAYIAFTAYCWWENPSFRVLSHPFVAIDSDLINGAGLSPYIIGFRAATLFFALALAFLGLAFSSHNQPGRFMKERSFKLASLTPVVVFLLLGSVAHYVVIDLILPSKTQRMEQLSKVTRRGQFVLHSEPSSTTIKEANAILAEAHLWSSRLSDRMGASSQDDIHIWLYKDAKSLERFTGAAHVHFAFPTHREIHISNSVVPHPTLGHEIAHVLIGERTNTILGVPGVLGVFVNQGLTEGLAVMLTPELSITHELTLKEVAGALVQSGKPFSFKQLFSLSPLDFFAHNATVSYAVAGAYLEDLVEQRCNNPKSRHQLISYLASEGQIETLFESPSLQSKYEEGLLARLKNIELPRDAIPSLNELSSRKPTLAATCDDTSKEVEPAKRELVDAAVHAANQASQIPEAISQRKQHLLEESGDLFWEAGDFGKAAEQWSQIDTDMLPPVQRRSPLAKQILSANLETANSRDTLDFLVYAFSPQSIKALAASTNLGKHAQLGANSSLSNYLTLRLRVMAQSLASDIAALSELALDPTLPHPFQLECLRLSALATAEGKSVSLAPEQFRKIYDISDRKSTKLTMLDNAERAERVASALELQDEDPNKNDIWLLGTNRLER